MEKSRIRINQGETSRRELETKAIWKLKVFGTIKNFLWNACYDIILTRLNLVKRKLIDSNCCFICNRKFENAIHVLWLCSATMDMWATDGSPLTKWSSVVHDVWDLWRKMLDRLSQKQLELSVVILRQLWRRRNMFVFKEKFDSPKMVVQDATKQMEEYRKA